MPVSKLKECTNCGWSYNPANYERCPMCEYHPDDDKLKDDHLFCTACGGRHYCYCNDIADAENPVDAH